MTKDTIYRVGRHTKRAILKQDGTHIVTFEKGQEEMASLVCELLNQNEIGKSDDLLEKELLEMASSTRFTEKMLRLETYRLEKENQRLNLALLTLQDQSDKLEEENNRLSQTSSLLYEALLIWKTGKAMATNPWKQTNNAIEEFETIKSKSPKTGQIKGDS